MSERIPKWPIRFLQWICPDHLYEEIEGDLIQKFNRDVKNLDEKRAKRRLMWNVIRFCRPGILLRNKFPSFVNTTMIENYFKVASRNILKRKLYSFTNAFGLSIGIAFCLLIYLFIQDEKSFDQFHANKCNLYLISNREFNFEAFKKGDTEPYSQSVNQNAGLGDAMLDELKEVQYMSRYFSPLGVQLRYQSKVFNEQVRYVDRDFFKMFSFKLLAGNPDKIFQNKSEIVLTPVMAQKYFGAENPIGKTMILETNGEFAVTVVGLIESPPANSSLSFDLLMPLNGFQGFQNTWDSRNYPTFIQLHQNIDIASFETNLNELYQKHTGDRSREFREREKIPEEFRLEELHLTKLTDIHLDTKISWDKSSDPKYAFILGGIAVLIIVIACINYISLSLTSSSTRRIEVGLRKVSGALKGQLFSQFATEAIVLAFISMFIGLLLVVLFLPSFNSFTNKNIVLSNTNWLQLIAVTLGITFMVGIIAGSYPALYLSGLKPIEIMKGRFTSKVNTWFTKPLIVIQFTVSVFLIITSVVMYQQMRFVATKDLGYDQHHVLIIPTQLAWSARAERLVENFRSAMANDPTVVSVAGTSIAFTSGTMTMGFRQKEEFKVASGYIVDPEYIPTLGIEFIEGRNFDIHNPSEIKDAVIVNEALVKEMKWENPLNECLPWRMDSPDQCPRVIGVVKDHHFLSLEKSINPMFLTIDTAFGHFQAILIKLSGENLAGSIKKLEKTFKTLAPDKPFEYKFLDENVALQYQSYERWMKIMRLATGFAILISCMGLFGIAGINVVNRTKEIGIRKVLGGNLSSIFILLNTQFVWLSLISFVLAAFPAWQAMNMWLDSFQFKIQISWTIFVISMVISLLMILITVSYHTIKTININPAETLKYE